MAALITRDEEKELAERKRREEERSVEARWGIDGEGGGAVAVSSSEEEATAVSTFAKQPAPGLPRGRRGLECPGCLAAGFLSRRALLEHVADYHTGGPDIELRLQALYRQQKEAEEG